MNSSLRVAFVGNLESPNATAWISEMARRGIEPLAISESKPSWNIEWAPIDIRTPKVRGLGIARRQIAHQIRRHCDERHVDVLHTHEANRLAIWSRSSGFRPQVLTVWGSDVLRLSDRPLGYKFGVVRALRSADAVTAGSSHLEQTVAALGVREGRIHRIGWGVDSQLFKPSLRLRSEFRTRFEIGDRPVLLSTRLHEAIYRIDLIIDAVAKLIRTENSLVLVIVGSGSLTSRLRDQVDRLGIADSVRFAGQLGTESDPPINAAYAAADAFCSIPTTDGGPLSVLEAMATELPVVVSDTPVMREWIQPGVQGYRWSGDLQESLRRFNFTRPRPRQ